MNDELGFEHLTKRKLIKFCKKFHKDCYRLVGQKMKLKDQLEEAKEILEDLYDMIPASHADYYKDVMERARQFLFDTKENEQDEERV